MVLIIDSSWCMRRGQSRSGLVEKDEEKGSGGKEGGTREHRDAMMSGDPGGELSLRILGRPRPIIITIIGSPLCPYHLLFYAHFALHFSSASNLAPKFLKENFPRRNIA